MSNKVDRVMLFCYTFSMPDDFLPFEEIEHTADVGLRARGRSMAELFANAAQGMTGMLGGSSGEVQWEQTVELDGLDAEHLLVRWLSEILYLYREGKSYAGAGFEILDAKRLKARCRLMHVSDKIGKEIKSVTHHGIKIAEKEGIFQAEVIFDV